MLTKVNQDLDESMTIINNNSFADLPPELTITEDNRGALGADFRFNMATFEASKKLLRDKSSSPDVDESVGPAAADLNTLLRRLEIFEGEGNSLRLLHTVVCTGFNAAAPKLLYSTDKQMNRAILDKGVASTNPNNDEARIGGPLFLQLLTDTILRSFAISSVTQVSCGFEHCIALTATGTVVSWGYGASGCLGHGDYISYTQPELVSAGGLNTHNIAFVTCGGYHNAAMTDNGKVFTWGRADVG